VNVEDAILELARQVARMSDRITDRLDLLIDKDKKALRMVDVDRAAVYQTHLGKNLKQGE